MPTGKSTPTLKSAQGKTKVDKSFTAASCTHCGTVILEDTKALQCDRCVTDRWICADCLNLIGEMYDHLVSDPNCPLWWFCKECEKRAMEVSQGPDSIEALTKLVQELLTSLAAFDEKLKYKSDITTVIDIETKLTYLEKRVEEQKEMEDRLGMLGKRLDTLESSSKSMGDVVHGIQQSSTWTDMKVKDCIEKAMEVRHSEDEQEKEEREKRRTSVIIHGVAESSAVEAKEREDDDLGVVASMLHEINCSDVQVNKVIRLGRKAPDSDVEVTPKSRPIKMVLNTEDEKVKVLISAKNLRLAKDGGWEKVYIHQDLTPKEREERKLLLQEKREREQTGETNLIIVGNKIVKRYLRKQDQPVTRD